MLLMASSVSAHSIKHIRDDSSGGDCTSIGTWTSSTKTCKLMTDLVNWTIQIDDDGITFDGDRHKIIYNQDYHEFPNNVVIYLPNRQKVTIKNLDFEIKKSGYGIYLKEGFQNYLISNNVNKTSHDMTAFKLMNSTNNMLLGNRIISEGYGIELALSSDNNILVNNKLIGYGGMDQSLTIDGSKNIVISNYIMSNEPVYLLGSGNTVVNNVIKAQEKWGRKVTGDNNKIFHNDIEGPNEDVSDGGDNNQWFMNHYYNYDEPSEGCFDAYDNGICDSPLLIWRTMNNYDQFPLVSWYSLSACLSSNIIFFTFLSH